MNKLFTKIATAFVGIAMAIGVGVAVGNNSEFRAAHATDQVLTFKTGSNTGTKSTIDQNASVLFDSSSQSYVTGKIATATNVYAETASGLRLGNSSATGTLKFSLSSSQNVTSVIVRAKRYNTSKASKINFNNIGQQGLPKDGSWENVSFAVNGSISTIQLDATNYLYIEKITLSIGGGSETLNGISTTGQTSLFADEAEFDYDGTLKATYSGGTERTVTPTSFKYGASDIDPTTSAGTVITEGTKLYHNTHNGTYIYILFTDGTTVYTKYQITVSAPIDPTSPTITGTAKAMWKDDSSWDLSGLTVTDGGSLGNITNKCELSTTASTATAGNTTITVHINYKNGQWEGNVTGVSAVIRDTLSDELTTATFGNPGSYKNWSGKSATNDGHSDAVYAGNSSGGTSYIQIRATSPSGIVSTTSGGKVSKVTVEWDSSTVTGRTLNVYGKSTAYSSSTDLYNDSNKGTLIGTIVYGTSTELTVSGNYEYVGLVSSSGAMYINKITIDWKTSSEPAIEEITMTGSPAASATIPGGSDPFEMSATATVVHDPEETLTGKINWTVSPVGAVTFNKAQSDSGETIYVTPNNTDAPFENVIITAASADTGFTSVKATSNSFNISKSYVVNNVTLTYTTAGGPNYDAGGASSLDVAFNTAVTYTGDKPASVKVNVSVEPDVGVTGQGNNKDAGNFTLNFTKTGSYTITSASVDNTSKKQSVQISISNIVKPGYEKINSTSNLRSGSKLIVHCGNQNTVMSTAVNTNSKGYLSYTVSDDFIPVSDVANNFEIITLESSDDGYWFLRTRADEYLYNDGTNNNRLKTRDSNSGEAEIIDQGKFTISFNNGNANVVPKVNTSRKIQYNSSSGNECFSCYTGTQKDIQLYLLIDTSPYFTISATSAFVGVRGEYTISVYAHNGAKANVRWSSSDETKVSIPDESTGTSVIATGVSEGESTIRAIFTALDGKTYEDLTCVVETVAIDEYVNIGVTKFTKITSEPQGGWEGTYLLVDETKNICFDGSASPLTADATKSVSIVNNEITASASMLSSSFNIKTSETEGKYTIRSNGGFYIGGSDKNININIGEAYELSISSSGVITSADSSSLQHVSTVSADYFRFYQSSTGNDMALYKADGERRAITDTLTDWYQDAKDNEYLVCEQGGTKSKINWTALSTSDAFKALTETDLDTLKRMTAKSADDNGNYLEDFISDYDYLVTNKGYTDFLHRLDEGGALHGMSRVVPISIINSKNASTALIVSVTLVATAIAVGGYFFLRKKKED